MRRAAVNDAFLPPAFSSLADFEETEDSSPLFALGLCLDSSPLYYLAIAMRLQELHEFSSSNDSESASVGDEEYFEDEENDLNNAEETSAQIQTNQTEPKKDLVVDSGLEAFRVTSRTCDDLLRLLTGSGALSRNVQTFEGDVKIDSLKILQTGLSFLGSRKPFSLLAEELGLPDATITRRLTQQAIKAITALGSQLIYWPTKRDPGQRQAAKAFTETFGLSGTIGVIGWTRLSQKLHLQGVVDHRLRFIDVSCLTCALPEQKHDFSALFRQSSLFTKLKSETSRAEWIPEDVHIVAPQMRGDTQSNQWMLTRYGKASESNDEQTLVQKLFNKHLCHVAAVTVQQSFSVLLKRFPRLHVLHANVQDSETDLDFCKSAVVAACILHNYCIDRKEPLPATPIASKKRRRLLSNTSSMWAFENETNPNTETEEKRNTIANDMIFSLRSSTKRSKFN